MSRNDGIISTLTTSKLKYKRRGQALVLYALLIPTLLVFAGAGLDLGWYYLTVSRMQNAADAAVMAGAWKMLDDEESMSDYVSPQLIDFVPNYILEDPEMISTRDKTNGDAVAKAYVKHNLSPEDATWDGDTIVDAYDTKNNKLTFYSNLYGRGKEITDEDDYDYRYWYQVILEEDVRHFFMPGWFAPMKAKVQSVAKFNHYIEGPNLFEQTLAVAESETYQSWDHIKMTKDSNNDADNRSVLSSGNKYREGDKHRFEILRLNGKGGKISSGNPYTSRGNVDQTGYDDLFIDWRPDMKGMKTEVLDIGIKGGVSGHNSYTHFYSDNTKLTGSENLIRRIHGIINFEPVNGKFPYPVRYCTRESKASPFTTAKVSKKMPTAPIRVSWATKLHQYTR